MKKFILSLVSASVIGLSSSAQSFEGQINYSIEIKGEYAAMLSGMLPNSIDVYASGKDFLIRKNGGMKPAPDVLTKGDEKAAYILMHNKKTAYKISDNDKKKEKPTIENKGEETVNGYKCTKYLVKFPKDEKAEVYQYMWYTKDIKIAQPKGSELFISDMEGFPVKIDQYATVSQMGTTMTINQEMVLTKITETKPSASLFEVPKKYKIEAYDEEKLLKSAQE